jgi:hypothetical protein
MIPFPKPAPSAIPVERVTARQSDALAVWQPGSLDELKAELKEPKQQFKVPDFNTAPDPEPEVPELSPAEARENAKFFAQTIVGIGDGFLAFLVSLYGHKEPGQYRLPRESYREIMPPLERCLRGKNVDLPPG